MDALCQKAECQRNCKSNNHGSHNSNNSVSIESAIQKQCGECDGETHAHGGGHVLPKLTLFRSRKAVECGRDSAWASPVLHGRNVGMQKKKKKVRGK